MSLSTGHEGLTDTDFVELLRATDSVTFGMLDELERREEAGFDLTAHDEEAANKLAPILQRFDEAGQQLGKQLAKVFPNVQPSGLGGVAAVRSVRDLGVVFMEYEDGRSRSLPGVSVPASAVFSSRSSDSFDGSDTLAHVLIERIEESIGQRMDAVVQNTERSADAGERSIDQADGHERRKIVDHVDLVGVLEETMADIRRGDRTSTWLSWVAIFVAAASLVVAIIS